jgi:hypothetical protein
MLNKEQRLIGLAQDNNYEQNTHNKFSIHSFYVMKNIFIIVSVMVSCLLHSCAQFSSGTDTNVVPQPSTVNLSKITSQSTSIGRAFYANLNLDIEIPATDKKVDNRSQVEKAFNEYLALHKEAANAWQMFQRAMQAATTWQIAHQEAQKYLQYFASTPMAFREDQMIAVAMMKGVMKNVPPTQESQQAISYYLGLLRKHGNYKPEVWSQGLVAVQGHWSDEAIHQAGKEVLQRQLLTNVASSDYVAAFLSNYAASAAKKQPEQWSSISAAQQQITQQFQDYITTRTQKQLPALPAESGFSSGMEKYVRYRTDIEFNAKIVPNPEHLQGIAIIAMLTVPNNQK